MNWLSDTTQAYRRGFVEGESGMEDAYLLRSGIHSELEEYHRGFADGQLARHLADNPPSQTVIEFTRINPAI